MARRFLFSCCLIENTRLPNQFTPSHNLSFCQGTPVDEVISTLKRFVSLMKSWQNPYLLFQVIILLYHIFRYHSPDLVS